MVNRQYHTEYFLMIAVAAAMHRLAYVRHMDAINPKATPLESGELLSPPEEQLSFNQNAKKFNPSWMPSNPEVSGDDQTVQAGRAKFWSRIGMSDVALAATLTWLVVYIWEYILTNL